MTEASTIEITPNVTKKGVALYPSDVQDVERLQSHFELDSFSQALRRAIRIAIRSINGDSDKPESDAA